MRILSLEMNLDPDRKLEVVGGVLQDKTALGREYTERISCVSDTVIAARDALAKAVREELQVQHKGVTFALQLVKNEDPRPDTLDGEGVRADDEAGGA